MRDAVIASNARTPITKACRGAINTTQGPVLMAHAICAAVSRAGLEGGEIEDFAMGSRSRIWICGRSTRPSLRNGVFAATSSASTWKSSTSMAVRSRTANP